MIEEIRFTIDIVPRSKKNSQQIHINHMTGKPFVSPSDAYKAYRAAALMLIPGDVRQHIDYPVNVKGVFYMPTLRACDLNNMLESLTDVLVDAGVIDDDNYKVVAGHDGSRVRLDREHPRTEVTITRMGQDDG